jgi:hypothetical protein
LVQKREDFTARDLEGDVVYRGNITKTLDQFFYSDHLTPFAMAGHYAGEDSVLESIKQVPRAVWSEQPECRNPAR